MPSRGLSRWLLISPDEASFERRGFPRTPAAARLERAAGAFLSGHNEAVGGGSIERVLAALAEHPAADRGFFAEGAAMGSAIRAVCLPWRDPLSPLLEAFKERYVHLVHVGVGWAVARLPLARSWLWPRLDPMLAPLAIDGRGFHDGYFHGPSILAGDRAFRGETGRVYDQGVGRSLWFSRGADPDAIATTIGGMDADRHDDLWAGVGLAAVYAGPATNDQVDRLMDLAGKSLPWFRQGAAFAIGAHARAGFVPASASESSLRISGEKVEALTALVDDAFSKAARCDLSQPGRYQGWRRDVAQRLARSHAA